MENFGSLKDIKKTRRHPENREIKRCRNILNKGLVSAIYKKLLQFDNRRQMTQ